MEALRKIWEGWKRFGQLIGDFMGRVVLTVFYFTLFAPFGIGMRLWGDPLGIKSRPNAYWGGRQDREGTLEEARRLS